MTKEKQEEQLSSIPKTVRDHVREKVKEVLIDMTIEDIQKGNILADFVEKCTSRVINEWIKEYGDDVWKKYLRQVKMDKNQEVAR